MNLCSEQPEHGKSLSEGTRTPNLRLRKPAHYPVVLRRVDVRLDAGAQYGDRQALSSGLLIRAAPHQVDHTVRDGDLVLLKRDD